MHEKTWGDVMELKRLGSLGLIALWLFASCGGGSGGSSGSSDFSKLTYSQAVALDVDKGLSSTKSATDVATGYHTLLGTDIDNTTDPTALQSATDGFADALSSYNTLINDIVALNHITYPSDFSALIVDGAKAQYTDPSGVDTLNSATDAILAKKKECDALFAQVPKLPSTPADFDKLAAAQKCVHEFEAVAAEQSFDTAVSDVGGLASGGAAGAAVVYFGGTLLSGGGLLVVTVAGLVGSRVVGAIWNACKPAPSKLVLKDAATGGVCSFSHAEGQTGSNLALQAVGTGTLQIFIEGCAPISFKSLTIANGQSVAISATCDPLGDGMDPNAVATTSVDATSDVGTPPPTTCSAITAISTVSNDPAPGETADVSISTLPAASGCPISYTLAGTDGYHQADTVTTDSSGTASFTVPGGAAGVVDTVTTTETDTGLSRTISYTF